MTNSHSAIMFFTTLLSIFVVVNANPFHKYPFAYLLDVGNEELSTVNTKQIRVTVPGGSIAVRYPAVGDGNTIAHLRISGIDFGTDLKANIIDGGPGYKYVILVFMGNEEVSYDAVVTIQTVPENDNIRYNSLETINGKDGAKENHGYKSQNMNVNAISDDSADENNSAEDLSDDGDLTKKGNVNAELSQSSSNVYYTQEKEETFMNDEKEETNGDSDMEENDDSDDETNEHESNSIITDSDNEVNEERVNIADDSISDNESDEAEQIKESDNFKISEAQGEEYSYSNSEDENNEEAVRLVNRNFHSKYEDVRPNFYKYFNVYPHEAIDLNSRLISSPESIDSLEPQFAQTFDDDENRGKQYRDDNNNLSDSDYNSIDYK